jgi:hypothetical protein
MTGGCFPACNTPENDAVGQGAAAKTAGTVNTAGNLTGGEKTLDRLASYRHKSVPANLRCRFFLQIIVRRRYAAITDAGVAAGYVHFFKNHNGCAVFNDLNGCSQSRQSTANDGNIDMFVPLSQSDICLLLKRSSITAK